MSNTNPIKPSPQSQAKLRPSLTLDDLAIITQSLSLTHPGSAIHRSLTVYYHKQAAFAMLNGIPSGNDNKGAQSAPVQANRQAEASPSVPVIPGNIPGSFSGKGANSKDSQGSLSVPIQAGEGAAGITARTGLAAMPGTLPYPEAMLPDAIRAMKDEAYGELLAAKGGDFMNLSDIDQAKAIDCYLVDSGKASDDTIQYFPLSHRAIAISMGAASVAGTTSGAISIPPASDPDLNDI